ncbi:MAG: 2-phosphosulfolactate phosphatase [Candidatus Kapabacteria bacterium]|nr:2-phosphosulfolactate phosphatase [Ignavibacteriota bacterium]MCW5884479.1 2-phosphosulfolactate phosphatase [Candidatus Kapabacteria bacterium]
MSVLIDAYLTPFFPEHESLFEDAAVVMIDVLRASSTVAYALQSGAKEIVPVDGLDKAVKIFSGLSKEVRFLGGERNGEKPSGFDAGNSPFEYSPEKVKGRSVILTTSNGTRIFQKAKQAKLRLIGSLVNHKATLNHLINEYLINSDITKKVIFLCAGNDGRLSYEDMLCAGAFIAELTKILPDFKISDPAMASMQLYNIHKNDLKSFLSTRDHSQRLKELKLFHDLDFCLSMDVCHVVAIAESASIRKY